MHTLQSFRTSESLGGSLGGALSTRFGVAAGVWSTVITYPGLGSRPRTPLDGESTWGNRGTVPEQLPSCSVELSGLGVATYSQLST